MHCQRLRIWKAANAQCKLHNMIPDCPTAATDHKFNITTALDHVNQFRFATSMTFEARYESARQCNSDDARSDLCDYHIALIFVIFILIPLWFLADGHQIEWVINVCFNRELLRRF